MAPSIVENNETLNLFAAAQTCLMTRDPGEKVALTHRTARAWCDGELALEPVASPAPIGEPGRPERPRLVSPKELPRRDLRTGRGHAALLHAICHIEFNAINLAWDAVYRFQTMPKGFYDDWVRIADEEATHFELMHRCLANVGHRYGDFVAHDGLWEMAQKTAFDPLVRMALVPRVLEARGLDVTPGIAKKLRARGDECAVAALEIILRDEVGHVAAGSRWFRHLCDERGLDPESTFRELLSRYMTGRVKGPFHVEARRRGGFSEAELAWLESVG